MFIAIRRSTGSPDRHTQSACPTRAPATAVGLLARARVLFAAHGVTRIEQIRTDNGSCHHAAASARSPHGARHKKTTPYTPKRNGKAERPQRIPAEELPHARVWTPEQQRAAALAARNGHYNYHRPRSTAGGRPPAARIRTRVTNVLPSDT